MSNHGAPEKVPPVREIRSVSVLLGRLMWVAFGPIALILITLGIVTQGSGWLTGLDAMFAFVAGLMLLGRWREQRSGAATRATGEPATEQDFRRFVLLFPLIALAVWVVANLLGNHVLA
jgi:hypothetical protein